MVHLSPSPDGGPGITAHIEPTNQEAAELVVSEGFELSDTILDVVSDLLVEIAAEEEGSNEGRAIVGERPGS